MLKKIDSRSSKNTELFQEITNEKAAFVSGGKLPPPPPIPAILPVPVPVPIPVPVPFPAPPGLFPALVPPPKK